MSLLVLHAQHHIFYDWYEGEAQRPCLIFLHEGLGCAAQWKEFPLEPLPANRLSGLGL